MDVALVQHAQHDVDGHHRRQDQQQFVGRAKRGMPAPHPGTRPGCSSGMPSSCFAASITLTASPRDAPGAKLKDTVTAGNCALVIDRERPGALRRTA